jgi:predicted HicB family RNase H-like nuclease
MKTLVSYKGYTGEVEYDAAAKTLYGHVIDLGDVITFESEDAREIEEEFHRSVDVYLDWCKERGKEPEKPFSGKVVLRMTPEEHRAATIAAARHRQSLNTWLTHAVAMAVEKDVPAVTVTGKRSSNGKRGGGGR